MLVFVEGAGLEKNLNSILPFGQAALKFCLPWASLCLLFSYLVGGRLARALAQWASENEMQALGRKTSELWEKPSEQGNNQQQIQPTYGIRPELNPGHIGGR